MVALVHVVIYIVVKVEFEDFLTTSACGLVTMISGTGSHWQARKWSWLKMAVSPERKVVSDGRRSWTDSS